jgi:hypothetical protein
VGRFNDNGGNVNGTFTFSVRGKYEDGTRVNFHVIDHGNNVCRGFR